MGLLKRRKIYQKGHDKLKAEVEEKLNDAIARIAMLSTLNLPMDIPDDLQELYEELGMPFFNSETKIQVTKLSPLQIEIWVIHRKFKRVLILKSQKIGVSSLCILITIWHALTDCMGMEIIINAQSDEQAKTHAQDLRRIILGSDKYRDYLITKDFQSLGLLKDEVTKVHTIYLHNPKMPRLPTKIIVTGQSQGALLSHKRVGFIWSSDLTISSQTVDTQKSVWAAMLSRLANSQGPLIVECPARNPEGPIYDTFEQFERIVGPIFDKFKQFIKAKKLRLLDTNNDFYVQRFNYERGIEDGFFTRQFIEAEKKRLGPVFGTFYNADFFASQSTWYTKKHIEPESSSVTDNIRKMLPKDDPEVNVEED